MQLNMETGTVYWVMGLSGAEKGQNDFRMCRFKGVRKYTGMKGSLFIWV